MKWLCSVLLLVSVLSPCAEKVQANGLTPAGQKYTLQFTEDLRFGGDEDEDAYLWASINTDLAVDDRGHIIIADPKTNELHEFDANGKFVSTLAGPGPGPGEMQAVNRIQFLNDGRLAVFEQKPMFMPRIQYFDKQLKFIEMSSPVGVSSVPIGAYFSPSGEHFVGVVMSMDMANGLLITKTGIVETKSFKMITQYSAVNQKVNFNNMGDSGALADMIGEVLKGFFAGSGVGTFDEKGHLYSAMTNKYEITKWSPDMKTKLLTITRKHKPIVLSQEEKLAMADNAADSFRESPLGPMITESFVSRMVEKADIPEIKLPVEALGVTPEGYLLVVSNVNQVTGSQTADIFDKEGVYIGEVTLQNWAFVTKDANFKMVFKNGYAYTVTLEDDENQLVRYTYKLVKAK